MQNMLNVVATRLLLLSIFTLFLTGCGEVELYMGLNQKQANEMTALLQQNGIAVEKRASKDKKEQTYGLFVDPAYFAEAQGILNQRGLPEEKFLRVDDIFKKEGLITSPLEERIRYVYALSQDVEETLAQIDGVVTSRVHVVVPEDNPFSTQVSPSSASIFIRYIPGIGIENLKSEIKLIVHKSIEGLTYDKISVVMLPAVAASATEGDIQWATEWGVRVPESSLGPLRVVIWSLLLIVLFFAGLALLLGWRLTAVLMEEDGEDEDVQSGDESESRGKRAGDRLQKIRTRLFGGAA